MTRSRGFHDRLPEKRRVKAAHGGMWSFEGPEMVPMRELVHVLRDDEQHPAELADPADVASRLTQILEVPVSETAARYLAGGGRADDPPDAAEAFGVRRTGLIDGLRATLERAGAG